MVDKASGLNGEIRQIKAQYVVEVGEGRRVWLKSIKTWVAELDELGIPAKQVAERSGIPHETVILWRYKRRRGKKGSGIWWLLWTGTAILYSPGAGRTHSIVASALTIWIKR